jgi:hypothetical protein
MQRREVFFKVILVFLLLLLSTYLSAETRQQKKAISRLKAKLGSETTISFRNGETIVRIINGGTTTNKITDLLTARAEADILLKEMQPYLHITMKQIGRVEQECFSIDKTAYRITYYQKNFWGDSLNEEFNIQFSFVKSEGTQVVNIENAFVYDLVIPKRPYISKERLEEILKVKYSKLVKQSRGIYNQEEAEVKSIILPAYNVSLSLFKNTESDEINHKLAFIVQIENYTIYVDPKTGKVIQTIVLLRCGP